MIKVILREGEEAKDFIRSIADSAARRAVAEIKQALSEQKAPAAKEDKYVNTKEAKAILRVKSNKKMQALRDQNLIRFSQNGRIILYDVASLYQYIENNIVR